MDRGASWMGHDHRWGGWARGGSILVPCRTCAQSLLSRTRARTGSNTASACPLGAGGRTGQMWHGDCIRPMSLGHEKRPGRSRGAGDRTPKDQAMSSHCPLALRAWSGIQDGVTDWDQPPQQRIVSWRHKPPESSSRSAVFPECRLIRRRFAMCSNLSGEFDGRK